MSDHQHHTTVIYIVVLTDGGEQLLLFINGDRCLHFFELERLRGHGGRYNLLLHITYARLTSEELFLLFSSPLMNLMCKRIVMEGRCYLIDTHNNGREKLVVVYIHFVKSLSVDTNVNVGPQTKEGCVEV